MQYSFGQLGIEVAVDDDAVSFLIEHCHKRDMGARSVKRAVVSEIGNLLSDTLMEGRAKSGDKIRVSLGENGLQASVEEKSLYALEGVLTK